MAIKILHSHATLAHERLFSTEIAHLRKLSDADNVNVLHILNVLAAAPLVLCGWADLSPEVPDLRTGAADSHRPQHPPGPALHRVECTLPANRVMDRAQEVSLPLARTCCQEKAVDGRGTIINFVHRNVIVMEHLTLGLRDFARRRREEVMDQWKKKGDETTALVLAYKSGWAGGLASLLPKKWLRQRTSELFEKALLLERCSPSCSSWRPSRGCTARSGSSTRNLAADNIMVRFSGIRNTKSNWRGEHRPDVTVNDILNDITGYPTFRTLLIDFGLADEVTPTRSWYDDEDATGQNKGPFLSPEAKNRRQDIGLNQPLAFSPEEQTCVIPPEMRGLSLPLMPGDMISHSLDEEHVHDLKLEAVLDGGKVAKYTGVAPRTSRTIAAASSSGRCSSRTTSSPSARSSTSSSPRTSPVWTRCTRSSTPRRRNAARSSRAPCAASTSTPASARPSAPRSGKTR